MDFQYFGTGQHKIEAEAFLKTNDTYQEFGNYISIGTEFDYRRRKSYSENINNLPRSKKEIIETKLQGVVL